MSNINTFETNKTINKQQRGQIFVDFDFINNLYIIYSLLMYTFYRLLTNLVPMILYVFVIHSIKQLLV